VLSIGGLRAEDPSLANEHQAYPWQHLGSIQTDVHLPTTQALLEWHAK